MRRPPSYLDIAVFVFAIGHGDVRQVGDRKQDVPLSFFKFTAFALKRCDGVAHSAHLCNSVLGWLPCLLETPDFLGNLIPTPAQRFQFLLCTTPFGIQRQEFRQVEGCTPPAHCLSYLVRMITN